MKQIMKLKKLLRIQETPAKFFEKMLWATVKEMNMIPIVEANTVKAIPKKIRETCKIYDLTEHDMSMQDQKTIFNHLVDWRGRFNADGSPHYSNIVIVTKDIDNSMNEDLIAKCVCISGLPKRFKKERGYYE